MDVLFVTIVALFIFPVDLFICLMIPSITCFLIEGVALLFTISWNGWLGVLGQNIQSILPSIRVSIVPSSVVVLYVTF